MRSPSLGFCLLLFGACNDPDPTKAEPADPADTGGRDDGDLDVGATRDVTVGTATMAVRAFAGEVTLPLDADGLRASSFWGGAQSVGDDGTFVLEMPEDGTSLVLLSDADGRALAQVLFAAHPDLVDDTIHVDATHVVATAVYAPSVLRTPDPRWTQLVQWYIATLPEARDAATAVDVGLAADPAWLAVTNDSWTDVRGLASNAFIGAVGSWAVDAGYGDPFSFTAASAKAPAPPPDTADGGDDSDPGQFEPQEPGAGLDGVSIATEWTEASAVSLTLTNHAGRWVFARVDGELAPDGVLRPTTLEIPDPVGFVVDLGSFYLDQMYEAGQALSYGTEGPDSWEEFLDWGAGQFGAPDDHSFGVTLNPGDEATLTVGGYGCGTEGCPYWDDDAMEDWVPSLVLTVLTEMVFPVMDAFEIEVDPRTSDGQAAQCVTDLEADFEAFRTLSGLVDTALASAGAGDWLSVARSLEDIAWEVLRSDELWACLGVEAFWTDEAVAAQLKAGIHEHADELDVTGVGMAIEFANAGLSVAHAFDAMRDTSERAEYRLYGPPAREECRDGADNDGDGDVDCDDGDCIADAACVPISASLSAAGAKYTGDAADDAAGYSVSTAGDVDGDGFGDLLIGAHGNDDGPGYGAGAAYLVLGSATPADLELGAADAQYTGEAERSAAGYSVSTAGDVDGDGFGDLLIGAYGNDDGGSYAGAAYLVLGSATPADLDLAAADAQYTGELGYDYAGGHVSTAGDVDGDGFGDLIIGASGNDDGGSFAGAAYLVLGSATPGDLDLGAADAQYTGEAADDYAGIASTAGDVDGDGFGDLLIGAPYNHNGGGSRAGAAYLVLGSATPGDLDLGAADAQYTGEAADNFAGYSVSTAGDVDADGFGDLLIGAYGRNSDGAAYLVLGSATPADLDLASAEAQYTGTAEQAGLSVSVAGDVDGDGFGDILIGAPSNSDGGGVSSGAAYLVFGSATPANLDLGAADVRYTGEVAFDGAGSNVSTAGDVDGDGFGDLLIGAYGNDDGGSKTGAAYLILGRSL